MLSRAMFAVALLPWLAGICACSADTTVKTDRDQELAARWAAWERAQRAQDCPTGPYDETALEVIRAAHAGKGKVHGINDAPHSRVPVLEHLKTRPNLKGEGVTVTAWKDHNRGGSADYSRRRSAWLVLDGGVYPINATAANDLGYRYDGMPERIQKRAGLIHDYTPGRTMMDQLGLEDYTHERRFSGGSPFPMCD